jgi:hypothetical protein
MVDIEALGELAGKEIRDARPIQAPNSDGVEPIRGLAGRAEVEVDAAALAAVLAAGAVVPQVDFVDVRELLVLVGIEELVDQVADLVVDVCEGHICAEDAALCDVLCEGGRIRLFFSVSMCVGAAEVELGLTLK